jgi:hypothetical protein
MKDFIPGLEPLGSLSVKWLDCIGERFADAIGEYCAHAGVGFMVADIVDEQGEDVFVSPSCRNQVSGSRWVDLRASLRP